MKFLICQIPLRLTTQPFRIANLPEHVSLRRKCIEHAIAGGFEVIVFPEYTYDPSEEEYMCDKSKKLTIIAGSYEDLGHFNQTVIFVDGNRFQQAKKHLSPHEVSLPVEKSVKESTDAPTYFSLNGKCCMILTCFDFYHLVAEKCRDLLDGKYLEIIFSPCCNDNPRIFFMEAEAAHGHTDSLTTIICNVSSLKVGDGDVKKFGGSAVFGMYDSNTVQSLDKLNLRCNFFKNMITSFPEGDYVCEIELTIPYPRPRMCAIQYCPNPSNVEYREISKL